MTGLGQGAHTCLRAAYGCHATGQGGCHHAIVHGLGVAVQWLQVELWHAWLELSVAMTRVEVMRPCTCGKDVSSVFAAFPYQLPAPHWRRLAVSKNRGTSAGRGSGMDTDVPYMVSYVVVPCVRGKCIPCSTPVPCFWSRLACSSPAMVRQMCVCKLVAGMDCMSRVHACMHLLAGNDLSRSFHWGGAFDNGWIKGHKNLFRTLQRVRA